ncbi:MAG: hypothetical protein R6W73_02280 [Candidatus Saliniplasma sp.]
MEYQQPPPPPGGQGPKERPTGITILAVLYIIGGLLMLSVPVMMTAIIPMDVPLIADIGIICWAVFGIIALLYFVVAFGLWKGQGWARIVAIILAILGLLNFPIGTIISIVILIYLFKDEVKAYFD